jgi:hypothetical protein
MKRRVVAACLAAIAVIATAMTVTISAATADTPSGGGVLAGPTPNSKLPVDIQVNDPKLKVVATLRGVGKQVYDCNPATGKFDFREPMAGLFTARGLPAGIHGKGPFWADFDGSRFDGTGAISVPAPNPAKDIAWLKVSKLSTAGQGVLANVQFVQRTDTRGGVAPATCSAPATVAVDYTTWYVFWA